MKLRSDRAADTIATSLAASCKTTGVPENPFLGSADLSSHVCDNDPPDRIRAPATGERHGERVKIIEAGRRALQ
jgi:hypothetical protein